MIIDSVECLHKFKNTTINIAKIKSNGLVFIGKHVDCFLFPFTNFHRNELYSLELVHHEND